MRGLVPAFKPTDKKFVYELWYTLGKPSINSLQRELKRLQTEKKTPLVFVPAVPTIAKWKNDQDWEAMSKTRDDLVEISLTNDAVALQNKVYTILSDLSIQGLKAQASIIKAAQLDTLSVAEARILLNQSGILGKDAVEQFKQAMIIAGLKEQYDAESKKPLAEILAWIDKTTGDGDKIKTILAAKISE